MLRVYTDKLFRNYAIHDTMLMMRLTGVLMQGEEGKPKHDWKQYFRVESYRRRGKGTVWRVVRIRDEHTIHRLVKSENRAIAAAINMLEIEVNTVEKLVERTILG